MKKLSMRGSRWLILSNTFPYRFSTGYRGNRRQPRLCAASWEISKTYAYTNKQQRCVDTTILCGLQLNCYRFLWTTYPHRQPHLPQLVSRVNISLVLLLDSLFRHFGYTLSPSHDTTTPTNITVPLLQPPPPHNPYTSVSLRKGISAPFLLYVPR